MKKTLLSLLAIAAFGVASNAQGIIGPKVGLAICNAKDVKVADGQTAQSYQTLVTPQAGIMFNARLGDYVSLRPEILYSQRGMKATVSGTTYTARFNYVEVPFNVVGTIPAGPGKAEVFAGASAGYLFGGKIKGGTDDQKIKGEDQPTTPETNTQYYNYLNVSLNFGVGYNWKGLIFQAGYNLGLSNINPHYEDRNSTAEDNRSKYVTKFSSITFGVAYLFGNKED